MSSLALLAGLFVYAPQSVRALDPVYIGPGGGSGECGSPFYETDGSADNVQFQTAVNDQDGDIDNILYVCPDTYDIDTWITVDEPLTIASVSGAANTILDATENVERIIGFMDDAEVIGLTFQNAFTDWEGAAIYAGLSLTVRDSIFLNNESGVEGGAIDFSGDAVSIVTGSTFIENRAPRGGAINHDYDLDLVAGSTFTDNEATGGRGGAINVDDDVYDMDVDGESGFTDNTFSNNSAELSGGAVYVGDKFLNSDVSGNTFSDNMSRWQGGALFVSREFSVSLMSKNTFKGNAAGLDGWDGGAFFLDADFNDGSQMIDNVFSGNTAGDDGGAVMLFWNMDEGTLISGNTFSSNKADLDNDNNGAGGGLQIDDWLAGTITNNKFLNNEAGYGGGLYSEDLTGTAVITMNTFRSNVATTDGGGIWLDDNGYDNSELAIFTKNSFRANRASDDGGALYLSFTNTEVGPRFFTRNMYRGNRAALGGAIAFMGFGSADVGEVAGDCSAPLTSSRIAVRIFKKDRFVSNRATRPRLTANVGLMACGAD
jgi:predicted outer membrane repeat protein